MSSLSPNVLRPVDPLLKTLFVEPNDYVSIKYVSSGHMGSSVTIFEIIMIGY